MNSPKSQLHSKEINFFEDLLFEYGDLIFRFMLAITLNKETSITLTKIVFQNLSEQINKLQNLNKDILIIFLLKEAYITYSNSEYKKTIINQDLNLNILSVLNTENRIIFFLFDIIGLTHEAIQTIMSKTKEDLIKLLKEARTIICNVNI